MIFILFLFVLFLIGIPICFSLGLVSVGGIIAGSYPLMVVIQRLYTGAISTTLIAIPLFILAGGLMVQGGISKRIVAFADALLGHLPSGLALVSILACMFFAAITGSAIAATAAIGGIMIPIMREKGYEDTFSAPPDRLRRVHRPHYPAQHPPAAVWNYDECQCGKAVHRRLCPRHYHGGRPDDLQLSYW